MYSTRSATPQTSYRLPGSSSTTTSSGTSNAAAQKLTRPATASGVTATRRTPTPTVSQNKLQPTSSTPRIIIEEKYHKKVDKDRQVLYRKYYQERFLGKGGFAQCYLFRQVGTNIFHAAKIIDKKTLEKENVKQKLFSEIKIHSSLSHRHIVNFVRYFEDINNVYILLEVCNCGSMMDLLKSRTRLTEQEARFFLHQILLACLYMNEKKVIHRDLKLGNLFLTDKMEIKIGDFGLATEVEFDGERKKTICGTPNYIAPEILYNKGHSFEVDIWSIGVILYTMLVGTPPFETKDVKETYKKIKHNDYNFPPDIEISSKAKSLIRSILRRNPDDRPDIKTILSDPFFAGHSVDVCPVTLLEYARTHALKIPDVEETMPGYSLKHPELQQQMLKLRQDRGALRQIDNNTMHQRAQPTVETGLKKPLMSGFPTSTMRPPLATVNTNINNENYNPNSQQVVTKQPLFTPSHPPQQQTEQPQKPVHPTLQTHYTSTTTTQSVSTTNSPSHVTASSVTSSPSLGSQRSVQTTQTTSRLPTPKRRSPSEDERKSKPQTPTSESSLETSRSKGPPVKKVRNTVSSPYSPYDVLDPMTVDEDDTTNDNVTHDLPPIWITHWADFSAKYGLTYLMSNGCVGAVYNDSSKMTYMPATEQINYYERKATGDNIYEERSTFTVSDFPPQMNKKVTLIKYFADVLSKLKRNDHNLVSSPNSDTGRCSYRPKDDVFIQKTGLDDVFVKRWLRTSHAVIFRLSNKIVQVCFHDQTEIILTGDSNLVSYTDPQGVRTTYALNKVVKSPSQEIAKRLKYTKDVLCQLISGSATTDKHRNQ
ncbi:predicted protein [Naegleria gruberi]|uniref:Predicted protein n=1 Tax=Naegleria gruberi TaxID=5762 RepID=D2VZP4_NAEGR|nr:uncharacterized protein NAEGRDRAFT_53552 [Naegleria gruberi]EFC37695.1 predicted protein [Naegleria gruberi]|eukprot:XP_002670439.1 predicted protein [Naegleria gruberi strain NEG-M]